MKKIFEKLNLFARKHNLLTSLNASHVKRDIRFKIRDYHSLYFVLDNLKIRLDNINPEGIALYAKDFSTLPKVSNELSGKLQINNEIIDIKIKVIYVNEMVGCKILNLSNRDRYILSTFFSYEIAAKGLYPLKLESLQEDADGTAHCLVGNDNCELFFVENKNRVVKFRITLFGNYVEISKNQEIFIGKIKEADETSPLKYKRSNLIESIHLPLTIELKDGLERFIKSIDNIDEDVRGQMLKMLKFKKN